MQDHFEQLRSAESAVIATNVRFSRADSARSGQCVALRAGKGTSLRARLYCDPRNRAFRGADRAKLAAIDAMPEAVVALWAGMNAKAWVASEICSPMAWTNTGVRGRSLTEAFAVSRSFGAAAVLMSPAT